MNHFIFSGRVAGEPIMRYLPSGGVVVNFTLIQSRRYADRNGQPREDRTQMRCAMFQNVLGPEKLADGSDNPNRFGRVGYIVDHVKTGHSLTVSGRIENRQYVQEGVTHHGVEVFVLDFDHNTSPAEAARLLAAREQRQAAAAEAEQEQAEQMLLDVDKVNAEAETAEPALA